jgi:diguanylate cyclase (GGDEF)-like protein
MYAALQALVSNGWLLAAILCMLLIVSVAEMWHQRQLLRNEQRRYWWILRATNMYIFEYMVDADVLNLSNQCAALLGMPRQIYQFTKVAQYTRDKRMRHGLRCIQQVIHTEEGKVVQVDLKRPDDSFGVFKVHSHGFHNEHGQVISIVGLLIDVTQEVKEEAELRTRAERDGLTQVYNSGTIRFLVEQALAARQAQPQTHSAMVMLDVDHFKSVNDRFGHQRGDQVLKRLSQGLREATRSTDLLGRLGGDEFCIYLPEIPNLAFLQSFCERLNEVARCVLSPQEVGMQCAISVGGVMVHHGDDFKRLYSRVDAALYEAKAKGRDTSSVHG